MDQKFSEALKSYMDTCDDAVWYLVEYCMDDPSVKALVEEQRKKRDALKELMFVDGRPPWSLRGE